MHNTFHYPACLLWAWEHDNHRSVLISAIYHGLFVGTLVSSNALVLQSYELVMLVNFYEASRFVFYAFQDVGCVMCCIDKTREWQWLPKMHWSLDNLAGEWNRNSLSEWINWDCMSLFTFSLLSACALFGCCSCECSLEDTSLEQGCLDLGGSTILRWAAGHLSRALHGMAISSGQLMHESYRCRCYHLMPTHMVFLCYRVSQLCQLIAWLCLGVQARK